MLIALIAALLGQPDPARIDAARAEAQALIEAAEAGDLFETATVDDVPAVRHLASGMICRFTPLEADNGIVVYPETEGLARGDNVACNTRASGMIATTYATRYALTLPIEDEVARASEAIRAHYPGAQAHDRDFPLLTRPDVDEPPRFVAFSAPDRDPPLVTFVLIRRQGEWSYKFRGMRGGADLAGAGMIGGLMFMNAVPPPLDAD